MADPFSHEMAELSAEAVSPERSLRCLILPSSEAKPVGHLGRGTHYTVLRVPIWHGEGLNPLQQAALLDFAIIWDEDHDERVMAAIEALYFRGLLAPVRFIGERKGSLCVLLEAKAADAWGEATIRHYREAASDISQSLEDP